MNIISSINDDHDLLLPLPFLSQAVSDRWYISDDLDEVSRIIHHHHDYHRHHMHHRHLSSHRSTLSTSVASMIITVTCITITITYILFLR